MKAVYYGKESLLNYINHVEIPNYRVYLAEKTTERTPPIFSSLKNNMNDAIKDFSLFADNILLGNPTDETVYYIKFYKDPIKTERHQNESFFAFNKVKEKTVGVGGMIGQGNSMAEMVTLMGSLSNIFMPMAQAKAENDMLRDKIEDLENREDDQPTGLTEQMTGILGALLPKLLDSGKTGGVQIAGDSETLTTDKPLLAQALEILAKHDPKLETDLYKLSQIAENNPTQFNMLLNMLRSM